LATEKKHTKAGNNIEKTQNQTSLKRAKQIPTIYSTKDQIVNINQTKRNPTVNQIE